VVGFDKRKGEKDKKENKKEKSKDRPEIKPSPSTKDKKEEKKKKKKKKQQEETREEHSSSSSSSSSSSAQQTPRTGDRRQSIEYDADSLDAVKKRHGFGGEALSCSEEEAPDQDDDPGVAADMGLTMRISRAREELGCAVCHDILFEPVLLACGHSFCRACLKEALNAASDFGGSAGMRRRCLTCRANFCGSCTGALPIHVLLWNTIKALFPTEVAARRRERALSAAEARAQLPASGEGGGLHRRGFALLSSCEADMRAWARLGSFASTGTHSIVLDSDDQCRQISLSISLRVVDATGLAVKRSKVCCLGDTLLVELVVINMEEDEACDGFPLVFDNPSATSDSEDDNECLVHTTHSSTTSFTLSGPSFSWAATQVPCVRGRSSAAILLDGDIPGEYTLVVEDQVTGAELKLALPVAPVGGGRRHTSDSDDDGSESSASSEEDLDQFEDDGFVVLSGTDGSGEEDQEDNVEDEDEEAEAGVEFCAICGSSTSGCDDPVLICDGCDREVHLGCASLGQVPRGDWYCYRCDPRGDAEVSGPGRDGDWLSDVGNDDDDDDDDAFPARLRKAKKRRRSAALFGSDSDGS